MDVLRHPRFLARALVLLFAGLLLAGCGGGVKGKGYLFTRDSQALRLNDEATLHQGHKELEFSPTPSFFGTLRLKDERDDVSIDVPRSAYGKRSFFIDGREAGLNYDIKARWREERELQTERDRQESCTAPGYCTRTVSVLNCDGKRYLSGTERYGDHLDDQNCRREQVTRTDYFRDCPGSRPVRERYQVYRLLVNLSFTDPVHKGPPAAEFDGESRLRDRFLERLSEGTCRVN